jgi:uncharacterized DUF497 family protein
VRRDGILRGESCVSWLDTEVYVCVAATSDEPVLASIGTPGCSLFEVGLRFLAAVSIEWTPATHRFPFDVCTKRAYTKIVGFEWDEENKAGINFRKHGVRMPEAIPVFDDPYAITIADEESDPDEQRFITLGMGAAGRLLVVVYAWRGENIRIISVRPAEAHEREEYEAER